MIPTAIADALCEARLRGMRDWLDGDDGQASFLLMGGDYPGPAQAGGLLLATVALARPCGVLENGKLRLATLAPEGGTVAQSGEATWVRCVTARGEWAFDGGISAPAGEGVMQIGGSSSGPNGGVLLYAGGRLPPLSLLIA